MNILNNWLSAVRGRAVWLSFKLNITQSALSQMRNGQRSIPLDRMADVAKHTKGDITVLALMEEAMALKVKQRKAKARASKRLAAS